MSVTIKDIAKAANVTPATVSRALSNSSLVKEETKRKIIKLAKELDYHPNIIAQGLVKRKTSNVGLVMPHAGSPLFHDSFFSPIIKGVSEVLKANNLNLLVLTDIDHKGEKHPYEKLFKSKTVEGIILVRTKIDDSYFSRLIKEGFPFVLIGKHPTRRNIRWVDIDYAGGAVKVIRHLAKEGHRKIAFVNGPLNIVSYVEKLQGYIAGLEECGLIYDKQLTTEKNPNQYGGYEGMSDILNDFPDVTATFFANDIMALGGVKAIRERALSIPDDMALVGFDGSSESSIMTPPLSTIAYPVRDLGRKAAEILVKVIEGKPIENPHVVLPTKLFIRESSDKVISCHDMQADTDTKP